MPWRRAPTTPGANASPCASQAGAVRAKQPRNAVPPRAPTRAFQARSTRLSRAKYKVRRCKGGTYPLSHLYGHFGLVRLTALGRDASWVKAWSLVREPDAGDLHVRL